MTSRPLATRFRESALRARLALLAAAVTALVVTATFVVLRIRAGADVRRVLVQELAANQRGLRTLQDRNLRLLLATSSLVSSSPTLKAALTTPRAAAPGTPRLPAQFVATIQAEVNRMFADLDRDMLVVTDDSGRVVAATGRVALPRVGESLLNVPPVRYALVGDAATADSSFGLLRRGGEPVQVGSVPILVGGYPVGALVLGDRTSRLNAPVDAVSGAHAIVTAGDEVITSTLGAVPPGARWSATTETASGTEHATIDGEEYVATALSVGRTEDGRQATVHLVRSVAATLAPITDSLGRNFLIAAILAVLLVGGGTLLVSRNAMRPLARFVDFMRAGTGTGTFATYEPGRVPAEIHTLTDAYNRLIAALGAEHEKLEQRTSELATTNETLSTEVRAREQAQRALHESEEQLRQSQKLEALGTLAGGVAHDFNNLLSVILGYAHFSAEAMPADSPERADIRQITEAAERATVLVRQLLAFSRKQVLQPQVVDLNRVLSGTEALLRPLIGEDIHLSTVIATSVARIQADPSQVEQVIVNLVVNARDAMPRGGRLTLETANVAPGQAPDLLPLALADRPLVMLAVRDTGMGMDVTTLERIFEPFFTTKAPGKGTGLGLSTVYGIVRQSEGHIAVQSEVGAGTTFRCYFPATAPLRASPMPGGLTTADTSVGSETVLVVEDEEHVRRLVRRSLESRGYAVLEASNGRDAFDVAATHRGRIDLLVTDVVMPLMSGKEVAELLQAARPGLRVLFITGYSDEAIERHGVLAPDSAFLMKPISPDLLARTVRDILDGQPLARTSTQA